MMWDCINRFFGIGLKPLSATYSVKKIAINLILLALLRVAFVLSSHGFLEPYYILIVNIIFVSIEIFIHGFLRTCRVSRRGSTRRFRFPGSEIRVNSGLKTS